jgi:predicted RNA-binding Zn-ribbon protein involved in translation (DUF1610 family)
MSRANPRACPNCGNEDMARDGGCPICYRCGWSPC